MMTPLNFRKFRIGESRAINGLVGIALILGFMLLLTGALHTVRADSLSVDTLIDESDGSCADDCSLRDALAVANDGDTINFDVSGTMVISPTLGQLLVNNDLTFIAPAAGEIILDGNFTTRVISVTAGSRLELQGITVSHGLVDDPSNARGAGIYNYGTLVIVDSTFAGNHTNAFQSEGGGIYNNGGSISIMNSTFMDNAATSAWSYAGAIYNNGGVITITNTTFYSNTAFSNSYGQGGGIYNGTGVITITNSTFYSNTTSHNGSALRNGAGSITLINTIVADSDLHTACQGTIINGGNNIDLGSTCGWGSNDGSMSDTDPLLGVMDNHGGRTPVFALLVGSPAIDGVTYNAPDHCPAIDQRGLPRPIDGNRDGTTLCDIGAYEYPLYSWLPAILLQPSGIPGG